MAPVAEASAAVADDAPPAPRLEFTPAVINRSLCLARTWSGGNGGQCTRHRHSTTGSFCTWHGKEDRWRVHGHLDLPVPPKKLLDFRKAAAKGGTERRGRPRESALGHPGDVIEIRDEEADDVCSVSSGDEDNDTAGLAYPPLIFGSGIVMGAEAVAAHGDRQSARRGEPTPSTPQGTPATPHKKRRLTRLDSDPKQVERLQPLSSASAGAALKKTGALADDVGGEPVATVTELDCGSFDLFGVPESGRRRILPLLERWGAARTAQLLGLWTYLGDGASRSVCSSALHVWGPRGSGKTAVVYDFLNTLEIRTVWLDCGVFVAIGELQARLAELLRRSVNTAAGLMGPTAMGASSTDVDLPVSLLRPLPPGRQLRAVDRLETTVGTALEHLGNSTGVATGSDHTRDTVQVVVVLDNAQQLARLGAKAAELLALPEILTYGSRLSVLTIAPRPLNDIGLSSGNRENDAVAFSAYTEAQASQILSTVLAGVSAPSKVQEHLHAIVANGLLKFASPQLGHNIRDLLSVGMEVLRDRSGVLAAAADSSNFMETLRLRVLHCVEARQGLGGTSAKCEKAGDTGEAFGENSRASEIALKQFTKGEKRLILSAYLASHMDKEDDMKFFFPEGRRKSKRGGGVRHRKEEQPAYARVPRPAALTRVLAIYHRLARKPHVLSGRLLDHLAKLRAAGVLHVDRHTCQSDDARVLCRVGLPLVRMCASDLNIDLAEYLCD